MLKPRQWAVLLHRNMYNTTLSQGWTKFYARGSSSSGIGAHGLLKPGKNGKNGWKWPISIVVASTKSGVTFRSKNNEKHRRWMTTTSSTTRTKTTITTTTTKGFSLSLGKRFLFMKWMRRFQAVSTHCGPRICVFVSVHVCMHVSAPHCSHRTGWKKVISGIKKWVWDRPTDGPMDRRMDGWIN